MTVNGRGPNDPPQVQLPVPQQAQKTPETVAENMFCTQEQVRKAHVRHLEDVERRSPLLTGPGIRQAHAEFGQSEEGKAIDAIDAVMKARLELATQRRDAARAAISQPGDTAEELRRSREWERDRRILDAAEGGKVIATARDLLAQANPSSRGLLAEEIGPYLRRRDVFTE